MAADSNRSPLPSRILVRGTNWVGDTILSLPAARELRRIFPTAHLTFWVPAGLAQLPEASGAADAVITFDHRTGGPWQRPFRMRTRLKDGRFDLVVLFQNAFEAAFTSWLADIPLRAGFPTDLRGPLLNVRVPLTPQVREKHQVFYYLAITDFLAQHFRGSMRPADHRPDCSITLGWDDLRKASSLLHSLGANLDRLLICLCPGSVNSEAKRWPAMHFARLADLLIEDQAAQVIFVGSSQESELIEDIMYLMRTQGAVNLAGRADLIASMAVMNLSGIVISNDTGSAHLAVAASTRVLTIFGPTSPGATAPYGTRAHIIHGEAPCAPCRHFRCPLPDHPCMIGIRPEAVFQRTREILANGDSQL
jgi:heptosyltransferase II